jgi:hypothetical protein
VKKVCLIFSTESFYFFHCTMETKQGELPAVDIEVNPPYQTAVDKKNGYLLKRKDFLGVDESADSHPNRTYYYKRYQDLDAIIETCSRKLHVMCFLL